MYNPNKTTVFALFAYCVLVKILPFILMHFGLDIRVESIYPWTFTPIFAFAIFGTAMFRDLRVGMLLPILALLAGDLLIGLLSAMRFGTFEGMAYAVYPGQLFQYAGMLLCSSLGLALRQRRDWLAVLGTAVVAPVLFFVVSNYGTWLFDTSIGIGYARDLSGLWQAYLAGLPFLRNQLISTTLFSLLLFSPMGIAQLTRPAQVAAQPSLREQQAT